MKTTKTTKENEETKRGGPLNRPIRRRGQSNQTPFTGQRTTSEKHIKSTKTIGPTERNKDTNAFKGTDKRNGPKPLNGIEGLTGANEPKTP